MKKDKDDNNDRDNTATVNKIVKKIQSIKDKLK